MRGILTKIAVVYLSIFHLGIPEIRGVEDPEIAKLRPLSAAGAIQYIYIQGSQAQAC